VAGCDDSEQRQRLRRLKRDNPVPECTDWLLASAASERSCWPRSTNRKSPAASAQDCVIRELCQDAQVLQQTERLGVPCRGQLLAGASSKKSARTLGGEELLAQQGMCKLCIALGTFEVDHVIPVFQILSGQQQELQALCLECHRTKTSLEGNRCTNLESRFSRYDHLNYAALPRLPPLFQLQK